MTRTEQAVLLGIDPGKTGAIAAVTPTGALLWVEDMPDYTPTKSGRRRTRQEQPA